MWMPSAPPTTARLLAVHLQPIPVLPALAVLLLAAYVLGVVVLRRRGDRWPVTRIVWWGAGVVSILAVTATGVDGYGMELFSVHMVQHMVLGMLTPLLLVMGAPVTLLLRSLSAGGTGRRAVRRAVLRVLHSRTVRVVTHPVVVVALFLFSLYGLYFTPIFDALMATMWGHNLMLIHFLLVGGLYFWRVLGVDPVPQPRRAIVGPTMRRVLELAATIPFHAFFGVAIMMSTGLIVRFYAHAPAGWGVDALADQRTGGGIAWGLTEPPTLLVLAIMFWQWQRSDARAAARVGRARAREEAELAAYNAQLARLAERDRTAA
ncbi:cytochrome c oxidase assembly protein [Pseudolysinimonas sp.]|uniref:cytochrome c oxidase assembly protein n=1 Tax=Pseudolysinimonas sp. TaxID=2680009 RepID=UPI003F81C4B4